MTEDQIPILLAIAFIGGCFAGLWIHRSTSLVIKILAGVIILNIVGWMTYGFIVNWKPTWGASEVIGGILYSGLGFLIFSTIPALVGCGISITLKKLSRWHSQKSNSDA